MHKAYVFCFAVCILHAELLWSIIQEYFERSSGIPLNAATSEMPKGCLYRAQVELRASNKYGLQQTSDIFAMTQCIAELQHKSKVTMSQLQAAKLLHHNTLAQSDK